MLVFFKFLSSVNSPSGVWDSSILTASQPLSSSREPSLLAEDPYSWACRELILPDSWGRLLGLQFPF